MLEAGRPSGPWSSVRRAIGGAAPAAWPLGLLGLALLAAAQRLTLLPAFIHPTLGADSWTYVGPAHAILDHGWLPTGQFRDVPYTAFVALLLQATGTYTSVGLAQLAMETLMIVFSLAAWWQAALVLPDRLRLVHRACAVLLVVVLAFHGGALHLAALLRPESPFMCGLALLLWLLTISLTSRIPSRRAAAAASVLFLAVALYFLRPHWFAGGVLTGAIAGLVIVRTAAARWWRATLIVLPLGLAGVGVAWPNAVMQRPASPADVSLFLPLTLTCWHLPIVLDSLRESLPGLAGDARAGIEAAIATGTEALSHHGSYSILGWDADWCMYRSPLRDQVLAAFGGDGAAASAFLKTRFLVAVAQHPGWYLRKVWRQARQSLGRPMGMEQIDTVRSPELPGYYVNDSPSFARLSADLGRGIAFQSADAVPFGLGVVPRILCRRINDVFGLVLAVAVGLAGLRRWRGAAWREAFHPLLPLVPGAAAFAGISLTCAAVHTLEAARYIDIQLPATTLTLAAALAAIAGNLGALRGPAPQASAPVA